MSDMGERPAAQPHPATDGGAQQGTTTFVTSAEAAGYDRHASSTDPQNDLDLELDDIKSIADFLAKPIDVASGSFTTSNAVGDNLFTGAIYPLILAQPLWVNKLQGFLNIRGDVKFRLVTNPTPFQQGMLRMSHFPCANQMPQSVSSHRYLREAISQLPGDYLSMSKNVLETTIQYVAPTSFLERDQGSADYADWGSVYIDVFEILRTGSGPLTVNWTLWMSIENLELSAMVQPQAIEAPARKRKGRNALDAETNSGKGPIAKIMSSGVSLANSLAAIPSLAPLATPASWALSALRGAAEAVGWSKPTQSTEACPVTKNLHWYNMNTDGNDNCAPLALRTDNKVSAITDASPGSLDEMSFNYIKTRWAFGGDFFWDATRTSGDLLYSKRISPRSFRISNTVGGNTVYNINPAGVFSEFYDHYRGSFDIRLRMIKTGFHTGTIAVTWTPGLSAIVPSFYDTSYMYRQIIDVQDGEDIVFNLPYLVAQDFLRVDDFYGVVTVHCVNPLRAPVTCSSSIDVMIEYRGGNDLVYVTPRNNISLSPFVPQAIEVENGGEIAPATLGSQPHNLDSVHHAMIANGDVQLSVADILKASYTLRWQPTYGPENLSGRPSSFAVGQTYATRYNGLATTRSEMGGDLYSFISSWYAFHRGSERFRFMKLDSTGTNNNFRAMLLSSTDLDTGITSSLGPPVWSTPNPTSGSSWATALESTPYVGNATSARLTQIPQDNGGLAVQAPFYSKYRYCLNKYQTNIGQYSGPFGNDQSIGLSMKTATGILTARSIGDDFQFAYFLGIPAYTPSGWVNSA